MSNETPSGTRRYPRISVPTGMFAAWYGGGDQQVSRVATLGMGGVFLIASRVRPVGTSLRLVFEGPGVVVQADGIVRAFPAATGWAWNLPTWVLETEFCWVNCSGGCCIDSHKQGIGPDGKIRTES